MKTKETEINAKTKLSESKYTRKIMLTKENKDKKNQILNKNKHLLIALRVYYRQSCLQICKNLADMAK